MTSHNAWVMKKLEVEAVVGKKGPLGEAVLQIQLARAGSKNGYVPVSRLTQAKPSVCGPRAANGSATGAQCPGAVAGAGVRRT